MGQHISEGFSWAEMVDMRDGTDNYRTGNLLIKQGAKPNPLDQFD